METNCTRCGKPVANGTILPCIEGIIEHDDVDAMLEVCPVSLDAKSKFSRPEKTDLAAPLENELQLNVADGGGLRFNEEKNLLELVPPEWVWGLGDVTTQGSKKYAQRNWERGMKWSIMVGCSLRHLFKFLAGERYDPETGCHHLAMVAWNVLALMSYDLRGIGENDIPESDMALLEAVNSGKGTNS